LPIIKPRDNVKRVVRSFRLSADLDKKLDKIATNVGETKTYVVESLLEFAVNAYEKEGGEKLNTKK
jgi:predicted DNA-binding protein